MYPILLWAKTHGGLLAAAIIAVGIARFLIRSLIKLVLFAVLVILVLAFVFHLSPAKMTGKGQGQQAGAVWHHDLPAGHGQAGGEEEPETWNI
jgi:hypothetical protein